MCSSDLNVSGLSTLTAVQGNVVLDAANTFQSAVSLTAIDATIKASAPLILGTSTLTGNLLASTSLGDITQTGPLTITGTSNLVASAGSITLTDAANSFGDSVSVDSSQALQLSANGPLTMKTAAVGGATTISSNGKLNLGTGTYSGKLKASSGGFDIVQSGPIKFGGEANFDAGRAKIDLFEPKNSWMGALFFKGGIIMINHPMLINAVSAGTLNVRTETTIQAVQTARASVAASASTTTADSGQSSNTTSNSASGTSGSSIAISVDRPAAANQSGLITVAVASDVAAPGKSFSFTLEANAVSNAPTDSEVRVMQMDGKPLPDWIRYEPATRTFTANAVPAGEIGRAHV